MESKLSNEEIARVFAMYLMCEVLGEWDGERKGILTGTHGEYEAEIQFYEEDGINVFEEPEYNEYDQCKLLLTPLSEITDEDAIEVGKIFNDGYEWTIEDRSKIAVSIKCADYRILIWFNCSSLMDFEELYSGELNIEAHGGETSSCSSYNIVDIIDYLRSKGYALPYKGKDLFELGIAIPKINPKNLSYNTMTALQNAQDLIKTENKSVLSGFNMFINGHPPITFTDGYYDAYDRIQGYEFAEKMAKENGIAFTKIFKCKEGNCHPFQYGGFFVCNDCGNKGVDKEWWKIQVEKDGNEFCCHGLDFINLQESSNYAFGKTFEEAISNYEKIMLNHTQTFKQ